MQAEEEDEDGAAAPFAWEVFVTECYLLARVDPSIEAEHALIAHTCVTLLEQEPDEQGYGSQLLFAVHDAIARGFFPADLNALFRAWRKRPKQLHKALHALWSNAARELANCADYCLSLPLDPRSPPRRAKRSNKCAPAPGRSRAKTRMNRGKLGKTRSLESRNSDFRALPSRSIDCECYAVSRRWRPRSTL